MIFQYSELKFFLAGSISNWNAYAIDAHIVIKDSPVATCRGNKYFSVVLIEADNYGIVFSALFYKRNATM